MPDNLWQPTEHQLLQIRFVYFKTRKLAFAPLPDKIVYEPREKTGIFALFEVENPSASPRGLILYAVRKRQFSLSVHNLLFPDDRLIYWNRILTVSGKYTFFFERTIQGRAVLFITDFHFPIKTLHISILLNKPKNYFLSYGKVLGR